MLAVVIMACSKAENVTVNNELIIGEESQKDLYSAALNEDILIVYTVSTRLTQVKESFEKKYPGLSVEIRDLRSPDLVDAVWNNYENGRQDCDVVICNDNSGEFKSRLVDTGAVRPYISSSIMNSMEEDAIGDTLTFINEAEMIFYNSEVFNECPITNIWELTDDKYKEKIYIPNPVRSFSTYALLGSILNESDKLEKAYISYYGEKPVLKNNETVAELFLKELSKNVVFTNSSDEVYEALGANSGEALFGFMVSSKLRMREYGYSFEPVYNLEPFSGSKTSFAVMLASDSKNVNTAKLFINYLLGEEDGTGEGYKPFLTEGTWATRKDVKNNSAVPINEIDLLIPDQDYLINNKDYIDSVLYNLK